MLESAIVAGNGMKGTEWANAELGNKMGKVKVGREISAVLVCWGIKNESKDGYAPLKAENSLNPRFRPPISEKGKKKKKKNRKKRTSRSVIKWPNDQMAKRS